MSGHHILYITYDGLTDPLGKSQILPYLTGLSRLGHRITILSAEKSQRMSDDGAVVQELCQASGMAWYPLKYHKRPAILSSMYDLQSLKRTARKLERREYFDIIHCRSYIPAAVGLDLKAEFGSRLLFDMRGFWPDEKIEGKSWPQNQFLYRWIYAYFKRLEGKLLTGADHIISLTHEGKRQLQTRPHVQRSQPEITVIPCCADFSHFPLVGPLQRDIGRAALGIPANAKVLAYLGSLGSWYMEREMLDFFRVMLTRNENWMFLFVTPDSPAVIHAAAAARDIPIDRLIIRNAGRAEVPIFMSAADLGIFFIEPVFSKKASSPTKMGEMLALGLPLITNKGVGDVTQIVEETGCGVAIDRFDDAAYLEALDLLEKQPRHPDRLRERALPWFDIDIGINRYDSVYRAMAGSNPTDLNAASNRD